MLKITAKIKEINTIQLGNRCSQPPPDRNAEIAHSKAEKEDLHPATKWTTGLRPNKNLTCRKNKG
jgi:hypothetical protein